MPEKVQLKSVLENQRPLEIEVTDSELFRGGDEGVKQRLTGKVRNPNNPERTIDVSLVRRELNAEEYLRVWKLFLEAGLPVVPSLRIDQSGRVYMTDLRADGSELYGVAAEHALRGDKKYYENLYPKRRTKHKEQFLKILQDPLEVEKIWREITKCIITANKNSLILPPDDEFELVIKPDGGWKLILLDLRSGATFEDMKYLSLSDDELRKDNEKTGIYFMETLQNIKNILSNKY